MFLRKGLRVHNIYRESVTPVLFPMTHSYLSRRKIGDGPIINVPLLVVQKIGETRDQGVRWCSGNGSGEDRHGVPGTYSRRTWVPVSHENRTATLGTTDTPTSLPNDELHTRLHDYTLTTSNGRVPYAFRLRPTSSETPKTTYLRKMGPSIKEGVVWVVDNILFSQS